jgi:Uma2 family endonuclease
VTYLESKLTTMSTQPSPTFSPPWQPDPVRQRLANHSLEDVLDLPADSPRVELVDGRMLPLPSPRADHQRVSFLLTSWLSAHAPLDRWLVIQAVGIAVSTNHTFEPDVLLLDASAGLNRHYFEPEQLGLVVEIVSPGTKRRDRIEKPAEYAAARIRHYWRVELDPVHVYAYRLTTEGTYQLAGDSADRLKLDTPFPMELRIPEITP